MTLHLRKLNYFKKANHSSHKDHNVKKHKNLEFKTFLNNYNSSFIRALQSRIYLFKQRKLLRFKLLQKYR